MTSALATLADVVRGESGIALDAADLRSLQAAARRAAPGMDASQLLRALDERPQGTELLRRLIDEVTVNETFFFRHEAELLALNWPVMLQRAHAAGSPTVRVWVAGCATGEEAYTLAMLASEAFASGSAPVSIVATDISGTALGAARRGRYGPRATRGIEPGLRERYLVRDTDNLVVGPALRQLVRFAQHNLVCDPPPNREPFDLIACRNVLIYFDPQTAARVVDSLRAMLRTTGVLILGAADRISLPIRFQIPARHRAREARSERIRRPQARPAVSAGTRPESVQTGRVVSRSSGPIEGCPNPEPERSGASGIRAALAAADAGRMTAAIELIGSVLAIDPLNAEAQFVRGLAELRAGDAQAATASLRRALYVRPNFWQAAFKLGRAQELEGDRAAAAQAYKRVLRTLDRGDAEPTSALDPVAPADVAAACRLRLRVLADHTATAAPDPAGRAQR